MTDETLEAAILTLRAQALGALGVMKDMARRPTEEEDVQKLALQATRLAQLEGAMLTLQQYAPSIRVAGIEALESAANPVPPAAEPTPVEAEEEDEDAKVTSKITDEELNKRSATYRRSTGTSAESAKVVKKSKKK